MRQSIKDVEEEHGRQLASCHKELIAVLDMAVEDLNEEEILKQTNEQLAIHASISERSAGRLKRILKIYSELE